ncbi:cobalt-precorrin-5B (C(1))-methyltransferase CbiD [Desulfococcus sp.]|uniref:cobalt-precorrin-5B (C(1))-methyltransferase CbiD n=1 Tax=Desulfococcus sp. TaxID=2025834 RepID=UPI003D13436E
MSDKREPTLRCGFTTGAAAAAAVRGALLHLIEGRFPATVILPLPTGEALTIPIHACSFTADGGAECLVVKDGGDDPDVTHNAVIGARVRLGAPPRECREAAVGNGANPGVVLPDFDGGRIRLFGGTGVGRVTKPGLEVAPGEPAINPEPRRMIRQAVLDVLADRRDIGTVCVEIFVPEGEAMAIKTLNARLGILGGISILGTTGIVRPMSHDAYIATIRASLSVAEAAGLDTVVMTTGRRSERFAQALWQDLPEEAFVQIGDFFETSLTAAAATGFREVRIAVFFGKAVKMAQGIPHTHAAKSAMTLQRLSEWALAVSGDADFAERVAHANTARHAFEFIRAEHPALISRVGRAMIAAARRFSGEGFRIRGVVFDFEGNRIFDENGGAVS